MNQTAAKRDIPPFADELSKMSSWPEDFARRFGRKPRILHMGNVANYAYINAKIQRSRGIDAYVMDPDFYHIMASPEWIEVEVNGDHGDDFLPDWSRVGLKGYQRPTWFVQGPFKMCTDYMSALMNRQAWKARQIRRAIDIYRRSNLPNGNQSSSPNRSSQSLRRKILSGLGVLYGYLRRNFEVSSAMIQPPQVADSVPPTITVQSYRGMAKELFPVFAHFDIIQGYTISAASPLAVGHSNVIAYELGTIRGLPFEDSELGRTTAWVYKTAPSVMITNVDCIPAADALGIDPSLRALALHAYDVGRAVAFAKAPKPSPLKGKIPYFFAPARHHWREGNTSWLKGNDIIIRAAGMLKRTGHDFRVVFVRWGQEIGLSEALIAEENLTDRVEWIRPQSVIKLWPVYCGAVAVLDQFRAPAFGGVALDSMALGKRLITAFDADLGTNFFSEPPPIFNCRAPEDVSSAMAQVLADPEDIAKRGAALQEWFCKEHSIERQLAPQFAHYARLIDLNGPAPLDRCVRSSR